MPAALAAQGATGADVEAWVRRAHGKARRAKRHVELDDLLEATRSGRTPLPPKLRHVCAVHEAGHMVVASSLGILKLQDVSVDDSGGSTRGQFDVRQIQTVAGQENIITMLLAGRAAEDEMLPPEDVTVGAGGAEHSDYARATRFAIEIETRSGFGVLGVMHLPDKVVVDLMLHEPRIIDLIKRRLDTLLARAREIVSANRGAVIAIAAALESRGYLGKGEIEVLLDAHMVKNDTDAATNPVADSRPDAGA
jgi:ATP-dependent Zn protease